MRLFILISYIVILILAVFIFFYHLLKLRRKKKSIGQIRAKWSSKLNLSFPMSWLRWGFILAYFLWSIYQLAEDPEGNAGHLSLMLLVFLLSFVPRWNVYLGSRGIIVDMRVISWENVRKKELIVKGKKRCLEIQGALTSGCGKEETKRIRLPKHAIGEL